MPHPHTSRVPHGMLPPHEADSAWAQVLARDRRADGLFVYAVTTTGVYCRPACPSRRPVRAHAQFFRSTQAAEAAGFRACLRCRPNLKHGPANARLLQVQRAATLLQSGKGRSLEELSREVGLSKFALLRGFQQTLGVTPGEFGRAERRQRFTEALRSSESTVTAALYAAGFGSSSRLYEGGQEMLGMAPGTLQRGGAGADIRYTVADSPLDRMLVAATTVGICAVAFGSDDALLLTELERRFPKACITRDDGTLAATVQQVLIAIGGEPLAAGALRLDVRRTAFQERVWQAMRAIPRGETLTYGELAARAGNPRAVRAVGKACGDNPVAVLIPCHRVLAKGDKMHNWRWGVERKERAC